MVSNKKLLEIKRYIEENFILDFEDEEYLFQENFIVGFEDMCIRECRFDDLDQEIQNNIAATWQQSLFSIIDKKTFRDVDVYKRAGISKQLFSKIKSNEDYHPDKDIAIKLCLGLKLNLDETYDLLAKAGYSLSPASKRDLIISYFIEHKEYDIYELDYALEKFNQKLINKY